MCCISWPPNPSKVRPLMQGDSAQAPTSQTPAKASWFAGKSSLLHSEISGGDMGSVAESFPLVRAAFAFV